MSIFSTTIQCGKDFLYVPVVVEDQDTNIMHAALYSVVFFFC
jgi:uncharacterized RmlC-like cupin family protein